MVARPEAARARPVPRRPVRQITLADGREITVYSVTVEKSYVTVDGAWATTPFYRGSELPASPPPAQEGPDESCRTAGTNTW